MDLSSERENSLTLLTSEAGLGFLGLVGWAWFCFSCFSLSTYVLSDVFSLGFLGVPMDTQRFFKKSVNSPFFFSWMRGV